MPSFLQKFKPEQLIGMFVVLSLHGAFLYSMWSYHMIPPPKEAVTLFVNLINPPPPKKEEERPKPPKPTPPQKVKIVKQVPVQHPQPAPVLVAEAPVTSLAEPVAPPPPVIEAPPAPAPVIEAPPAPPPAPVTLSSELSLACPDRAMPNYPAMSRRSNEQGKVVIHVELDTSGKIIFAKVEESSGFKRLDDAGLTAVKSWHCKPAMRNGEAVRAYALQPFDFILEGR